MNGKNSTSKKKRGRPRKAVHETDYPKRLVVEMTEEMHAAIKAAAADDGMSANEWMRRAAAARLRRRKK